MHITLLCYRPGVANRSAHSCRPFLLQPAAPEAPAASVASAASALAAAPSHAASSPTAAPMLHLTAPITVSGGGLPQDSVYQAGGWASSSPVAAQPEARADHDVANGTDDSIDEEDPALRRRLEPVLLPHPSDRVDVLPPSPGTANGATCSAPASSTQNQSPGWTVLLSATTISAPHCQDIRRVFWAVTCGTHG